MFSQCMRSWLYYLKSHIIICTSFWLLIINKLLWDNVVQRLYNWSWRAQSSVQIPAQCKKNNTPFPPAVVQIAQPCYCRVHSTRNQNDFFLKKRVIVRWKSFTYITVYWFEIHNITWNDIQNCSYENERNLATVIHRLCN